VIVVMSSGEPMAICLWRHRRCALMSRSGTPVVEQKVRVVDLRAQAVDPEVRAISPRARVVGLGAPMAGLGGHRGGPRVKVVVIGGINRVHLYLFLM